jgi:hypothetical protein
MADATSTFTVRGQADVDDAVRGLNRLGDEAEKAGDKAKGMGDYFRATVAGILSAETAMKGLELVLGAAGAAFDFARDATLEYMQSTAEGRAQVSLFTTEIGKLKTAIGESVTNSEAFGDGFDAAIEVLRDLTEIMPGVIQTLDNYYLTAVKVEEATSGFASAMNTLGGALYNLTPFAAVENAFTLVGTAANNVTEVVGEAEREVRVIAEAAAAATEPINGFGTAWLEATSSINTANAALQVMNLPEFFFGIAEAAPEATTATRSYAAAIDMVAVANEKLKTAQEAAAQAMRESIEAMNEQDAATMAMLEGFNRVGQEELARVQEQIAAAIAMAVEAKGKIAAALQPGEGEGGGFFDVQKLEKDYDAMAEATSAFEGTASGLGSSLSSSFGAALGSTENFGKAFKAALGQALVSQGITEILTGISNMIPFGPMFNPVAGAARLAGGSTMLAIGKAMGGKGSAPGGAGGGGGRSVGESSGMTPMTQPQRQGPTNLIDYTGVTIVTNDTDSMRTLIDRQARTATAGAGSRV